MQWRIFLPLALFPAALARRGGRPFAKIMAAESSKSSSLTAEKPMLSSATDARYSLSSIETEQKMQGDGKCTAQQDLVIAMDASGSLMRKGFETVRAFAANLTQRYAPEAIKLGVVAFGNGKLVPTENGTILMSPAETVSDLTNDMEAVRTKVEAVTWMRGFTNMAQGLFKAKEVLGSGGRDSVRKAVLVISDGKPNFKNQTATAVQELKDDNIIIYMAPIVELSDVEMPSLQSWASEPTAAHYLRIPGIQALGEDWHDYLNELLVKFCPDAYTPTVKKEEPEPKAAASSDGGSGGGGGDDGGGGGGGTPGDGSVNDPLAHTSGGPGGGNAGDAGAADGKSGEPANDGKKKMADGLTEYFRIRIDGYPYVKHGTKLWAKQGYFEDRDECARRARVKSNHMGFIHGTKSKDSHHYKGVGEHAVHECWSFPADITQEYFDKYEPGELEAPCPDIVGVGATKWFGRVGMDAFVINPKLFSK